MGYNVFISYSRRDNQGGRITQLVDRIKTDFAAFAKRELVPFFDQTEIRGMQDWRQRILQGLRESRLLLACLSPTYLTSEYCEWEFVEYLKYEIGHLHGFNGVAPIYFVQVPGWDEKDFDKHCADWIAELRRRQNFDLRPWHEQGETVLREAAIQERMSKLNRQIVQTITRGERAEKSLGNVDAHNPHFIGRTTNLRRLRENFVTPGHIGVVTAVNGVGGLGKTALGIEYAHAFADEYGGGRWQVRCAGKNDLRLAIAELATPLGFEFTDEEKKNTDLQFERTRRELKKLADAHEPHRCLLLLDNVDCAGLLDPAQLARLNSGDWLHVLATTRLGENELHGAHRDRSFLAIDELPPDDALALVESYQPDGRFRSEAEREAAREIVRLLGCFTLAVESAAVYLGQFANDVTCATFLARLKKEGLEGLDTAASQSSEGVLHGEKRLSVTLQPTLERLGAPETLALKYVSLLPPDRVPLPWLRALIAKTFPEMGCNAEAGYPDPWKNVTRRLLSLRLLQSTDLRDADGQPIVVRVHRLLQSHVLATEDVQFNTAMELVAYVGDRAVTVIGEMRSPFEWETSAVIQAIPSLLLLLTTSGPKVAPPNSILDRHSREAFLKLGNAGQLLVSDRIPRYLRSIIDSATPNPELRLTETKHHRTLAEVVRQFWRLPGLGAAPSASHIDPVHSLWDSQIREGDEAVSRGDFTEALRNFTQSLGIRESVAKGGYSIAPWQEDLAISHLRLFGVEEELGHYLAAEEHVQAAKDLVAALRGEGEKPIRAARELNKIVAHQRRAIRFGTAILGITVVAFVFFWWSIGLLRAFVAMVILWLLWVAIARLKRKRQIH